MTQISRLALAAASAIALAACANFNTGADDNSKPTMIGTGTAELVHEEALAGGDSSGVTKSPGKPRRLVPKLVVEKTTTVDDDSTVDGCGTASASGINVADLRGMNDGTFLMDSGNDKVETHRSFDLNGEELCSITRPHVTRYGSEFNSPHGMFQLVSKGSALCREEMIDSECGVTKKKELGGCVPFPSFDGTSLLYGEAVSREKVTVRKIADDSILTTFPLRPSTGGDSDFRSVFGFLAEPTPTGNRYFVVVQHHDDWSVDLVVGAPDGSSHSETLCVETPSSHSSGYLIFSTARGHIVTVARHNEDKVLTEEVFLLDPSGKVTKRKLLTGISQIRPIGNFFVGTRVTSWMREIVLLNANLDEVATATLGVTWNFAGSHIGVVGNHFAIAWFTPEGAIQLSTGSLKFGS